MINMFLSLFIAVNTFIFFSISFQMFGVNRVVIGTPLSIFENSIPMKREEENPVPYFAQDELFDSLISYYDKSLLKYVDSYTMKLNFLNSDDSFCLGDECQRVEIMITAPIALSLEYKKTLEYEIWSRSYGS